MLLHRSSLPPLTLYPPRKQTQKKHRIQCLTHCYSVLYLFVIPLGLEPKTYCLEGSCSIQLSYGTIKSAAKLTLFCLKTK